MFQTLCRAERIVERTLFHWRLLESLFHLPIGAVLNRFGVGAAEGAENRPAAFPTPA